MSSGERFPSSVAGPVAKRFVELIAPYCHQVVIAGSLRRRLPTVGDIEVVATPIVEQRTAGLFGDVIVEEDRLGAYLECLLIGGDIQKRPRADGKTFWGPKAKYLTFEGIPVDLFTPDAARFGIILVIRTGPAQFSHRLVATKDQSVVVGKHANGHEIRRPGLLPEMYRVQDGWLTRRVSGEKIATPDEQTVFELLGIEYAEPWNRG